LAATASGDRLSEESRATRDGSLFMKKIAASVGDGVFPVRLIKCNDFVTFAAGAFSPRDQFALKHHAES
jgi:hypothetical protein